MARLTQDEWVEVRREWESSPRQNLLWLTAEGGGRWNITEEAVRRRRAGEAWQKNGDAAVLAHAARPAVDDLVARREVARAAESPNDEETDEIGTEPKVGFHPSKVGGQTEKKADPTLPDSTDPEAAIRAEILDIQRREWKTTRALIWGLVQSVRDDKDGKKAPLEDRLKVARVVPWALQFIHDGERRTWGLDADLIDYESLTALLHGSGRWRCRSSRSSRTTPHLPPGCPACPSS